MRKYSRIAVNARLGDGMLGKGKNAYVAFMSTDKTLLEFKERMLLDEGYGSCRWGTQPSGYGGTKIIHNIQTYVNANATRVREATIEDVIATLDKEDLFLWYMDDGSWHIKRNTMHLYSNMLDEAESKLLIARINELYGIEPRLRIDRKKDGRQFYYLYFPRELVKLFRPEFKAYAMQHELESMYYKFGGLGYEEAQDIGLSAEVVRNVRRLRIEGIAVNKIANQCSVTYEQARGIIYYGRYKDVI